MSSDLPIVKTVTDTYILKRISLLGDLLSNSNSDFSPPEIVIPWIFFPTSFPPFRYGADGHEVIDEDSLVPPSVKGYRMYAGGHLELFNRLLDGQSYMKVSSVEEISSKDGRSGKLTFIDISHEVVDAVNGAVAHRDIQNLVYLSNRKSPRELDASDQPIKGIYDHEASATTIRASFSADSSMLFRYSALTYNGHKIHLDRDYCREVEKLPALVVHGPLLATVGATLADRLSRKNESIVDLTFRLQSTLFEGERAIFSVERKGDSFFGSAALGSNVIISFEGSFGTL
ncbi:MAG: hypothetical protein M0019_11030 [Actinomycetota bacterium]|nr:hypothetical protein [Actinomycetota bacterium]